MAKKRMAETARTQDAPSASDMRGFDPDKMIQPESIDVRNGEASDAFDPDKLIDGSREIPARLGDTEGIDVDRLIDPAGSQVIEKHASESAIENAGERKMLSTEAERMKYTPVENGPLGSFEGERGNSKFIPKDAQVRATLEKYGLDGIVYKRAIPDFSPCSEASVSIDMTSKRYGPEGNFAKADDACAKQWNDANRDGRSDWTSRDVCDWRRENNYSWHECSDMKTCQLVPQDVHNACRHFGGVAECLKHEGSKGGFDD